MLDPRPSASIRVKNPNAEYQPALRDNPPMQSTDFLIVGAGMAGASMGYWLARQARVMVLERESQPGYHSTGRSAAMFMENYGTPQVRALTTASRAFFETPPPGFTATPLLQARGALMFGNAVQREAVVTAHADALKLSPKSRLLNQADTLAMVPVLRPEVVDCAFLDPAAADIDAASLHQGFLRGIRAAGGQITCNAELLAASRGANGWTIHTSAGEFHAAVLVNAAGAWADDIARKSGVAPMGVQPLRRSAFTFAPPDGLDCRAWPLVMGVDESETFYFKPDAGQLLGSPANADPVPPHDVQAEAFDVALGIHRIEQATTLTIRRPSHVWAGLRSFAPDGSLVLGFDTRADGFFWVAGQGGYGIQTAPAAGQAAAALALGRPLPDTVAAFGLTAPSLGPARLAPA